MSDFKLLTVAKVLGLDADGEKKHDARSDVGLTRKMFHLLKEQLPQGSLNKGSNHGQHHLS